MGESTDAKSSKVDKRSLGFDKRKSAYLPDEIASYEAMAEKKEPFKARFPPPVPNTLALSLGRHLRRAWFRVERPFSTRGRQFHRMQPSKDAIKRPSAPSSGNLLLATRRALRKPHKVYKTIESGT